MPKTYITELPNGNYKIADEKAVKKAKILEQRRLEIQRALDDLNAELKHCKHEVCYDESGYMYDTRICVACGHKSLL